MAAFMIPLSPKKKAGQATKTHEILTLAPFNPIPRLIFQDIKVGQETSQVLLIYNPSNNDAQVELSTKLPLSKFNLLFNYSNFEVKRGHQFELKITWTPKEAGTWKVPVSIRTSIKFRTDFLLLCSAVNPSKNQKKVLGAQNCGRTSRTTANGGGTKPKPLAQGVGKSAPKALEPERRKTFLVPTRSNKENVVSPKKLQRSQPEPQPEPQAEPQPRILRPQYSVFENIAVSPFVPDYNRFRDVQLSPVVIGSWNSNQGTNLPQNLVKQEVIESTTVRRETYDAVEATEVRPTFLEKVDDFEDSLEEEAMNLPKQTAVDYSFRDFDSICSNVFEPGVCSSTVKMAPPQQTFDEFSPSEYNHDRLSAETFVVGRLSSETFVKDRLSTETYVRESHFNSGDCRSPTFWDMEEQKTANAARLPGRVSPSDNSGNPTLESIVEESMSAAVDNPTVESRTSCTGACTALTISPPKPKKTLSKKVQASKPPRNSPKLVTKRKISLTPDLRKPFSPVEIVKTENEEKNQSSCRSGAIPRTAMPRLTLSRTSSSRQSVAGSSSTLGNLTRAKSSSRQSLSSTLSSSRQSLAPGSSRVSLCSSVSSSSSRVSKGSARVRRQNKSEFLYNADALLTEMINNDVIAGSSADPFLTNTLFYDDTWKLRQEKDMIKWLNALLTPPVELASNADASAVNIADIWQRCCRTEQVDLAPTREDVSAGLYDAQARLNTLRKAAVVFLTKTEIRQVLSKVAVQVDKKLLMIREDKDLHLDLGLKYEVMELLLSYNPLWLRIALEAVYGRTVPMISNSDVGGLAQFIMENLLTDKHIVATHSHPTVPHLRLPSFGDAMKKFILKKFFFLVYVLDRAKANKLIGHDPCLFMKKAKYKESREILIAFASMFLSGVGDILKHLALLGYHVTVKQQYLDEFEFAVTSLKDLRDGVRLVRVMEIILKTDNLMSKLRTPAISMLQKVHNIEVALKSLSDAGYVIVGNITAKDLVNGHYEKTLSLLWQIIYKFQAPRLEEAAKVIQTWWKKTKLRREIHRRIEARRKALAHAAATRIQSAWRAVLARKRVALLRLEKAAELARKEAAAVIIQKTWRMYSAQNQLKRARWASNLIKEWYFGAVITRELRTKFLQKRQAAIKIQSVVRGYVTRKRLANLRRTAAALRLQTWFRRLRTAKILEAAAIHANHWVEERKRRTKACLIIQSRVRAHFEMKKMRSSYLTLRTATVTVQQRFRCLLLMKQERAAFLSLRHSVMVCQQRYRANIAMRKQRAVYLALKRASIVIQRRFRAIREMRLARARFQQLRESAVKIQMWFRATRLMRLERDEYVRMKHAVVVFEERYLALIATRREKNLLKLKKKSAITIQQWYRSIMRMKKERSAYLRQVDAVRVIQRAYRSYKHRQTLNAKAVIIQRKWRATIQAKIERETFIRMRSAARVFQAKWRARVEMKKCRARYVSLKNAALVIQQRWRAVLAGRAARQQYLTLKQAVIFVQRKFRQKKWFISGMAQRIREETSAIKIQALWRGYSTRKRQCSVIAAINERAQIAGKAACEEKTLKFMAFSAFEHLKHKRISKMYEALNQLDMWTLLSRELCLSLVEQDIVADIYHFLSKSNRSEAYRVSLMPATALLLNFARFDKTLPAVWQEGNRVFFYLHLMNIWINKEEEIFLNCATVLWHFARRPEMAQVMVNEPTLSRFLETFFRKASKKASMMEVRNVKVLPTESPSWGLVLKDGRPLRFLDQLFAVKMLIYVLYGKDDL